MTRVHDMGGRFGDGPVILDPEGEVFHDDWHGRALALTLAAGALGQWNLDISRHARERLGADYNRFSYYEKWIAATADLLVENGVLDASELTGAPSDAPHPLAARKLAAEAVSAALSRGGPVDRDAGPAPIFQPGQAVLVRRPADSQLVEGGHTRLPAYAAGARGKVLRCHGNHILPDAHAHGLGEAPEPVYAVAFPASELWAHPEHPRDEVVIDLWQSYLTAA